MALLTRSMQTQVKSNSALMYIRALAYSTVYDLHKAFTKSILLQKNIKEVFRKSKLSEHNGGIITASLTFHGDQPKILPMDKWMITDTITISKSNSDEITNQENIKVEAVETHPMYKSELSYFVNDSRTGRYLIVFSAFSKNFVLAQKPNLLNGNHLLVWQKFFETCMKCKLILSLDQKI